MKIVITVLAIALILVAVALLISIRRIKILEKGFKRADETDKMTGLLNRDGFMEQGQLALKSAQNSGDLMALIVFDVEELGRINTFFGTDAGDEVVKAFAFAAKAAAGKNGIAGRVNTDDFALLTFCSGEAEAQEIADKFRTAVMGCLNSDTLRESVNFFAGVCDFDGHDDIYTMYNKASLCLFTKDSNKRVNYFTRDMENSMVEKELLRSEMMTALETGQFELYYQPKISFKTGEIRGLEALIRWHHPTKGFVPPSDFIPLAEKSGIITKIDEWGLFTACRQSKAWQDKGMRPVKISVNMSQAQFYRTDVYATISAALAETKLDPKWLEVEVTETMAMQDIDRTINVLGKIRDLGVSVSMDDFGSGYSSLSSLKTLPLDILKIDRSLVCDLDENKVSKKITNAIVELGKAMELVVLAEGVETRGQIDFLTEIGCDLAQGYFYSKPCPAKDIEALLVMPLIGQPIVK